MSFPSVSRHPSKQGSGSSSKSVEEKYHIEQIKEEKDESEQQDKKKKRKKKVGSKEERKLKREAEKLKQIYAPKDSHIQMITPEILQKLRGESNTRSPRTQSLFSYKEETQRLPVTHPDTQLSPHLQCPGGAQNFEYSDSALDFPVLRKSEPITSAKAPFTAPVHRNKVKISEAKGSYDYELETDTRADVLPKAKEKCSESAEKYVASKMGTENSLEPPIVSSKRKPSKKPMIVSINELIEAKKEVKTIVKTIERKRKDSNEKFTIGNLLDSSGPVVMNRGKIRENPKPKRPSPLKKAIMKTRALRKANITTNFARNICRANTGEKVAPEAENATGTNTFTYTASHHEQEDSIKSGDENINQCCSRSNYDNKDVNINEDKSDLSTDDPYPNPSVNIIKTEADIFSDKIKEIIKNTEDCVIQKSDNDISKELHLKVKTEMHSKKFRPYCDMYTSKELHGKVWELLKELHRFQDRLYHSDPLKYKIKKRYIHGLKDVHANLSVNKLQLIIIAPDIEPNNEKGGLDDRLESIISLAREYNVPYIFSGNRYILGKPIRIKTPVSAIGILDYQATEELCKNIIEKACKLREEYQNDFSEQLMNLKL